MPYKNPEDKRRYDATPAKRAKDRERSRRRYWSNPEYRERQRQQARLRKRTPSNLARDTARKQRARQDLRRQIGQLKMRRGCVDCGYAEHPVALQFDHVKGEKLKMISSLVNGNAPWHIIAAEIAKCEVRCANCHAIRTMERLQHLGKFVELGSNSIEAEQLSLVLDE